MYRDAGLLMRAVEPRDLEPLRRMHNDPGTLYMLTDTTPVTPSMQRAWFESLGAGASRRYAVEDEAGALIGLVRIDALDLVNRTASIGLDIMPHVRGCGYGRRVMGLLVRYCFEELGLRMLWLATAEFNERAQRLYARLGFRETGRLPEALCRHGSYHDIVHMALRRAEWEKTHES